jgi:dephospho-CoA kinase
VKIIGLTGGIASGKSTAARILKELGATVIDADQLSREVVAPGAPALAAIADAIGPRVLNGDGSLNREVMGSIVFADPEARRTLEGIVHPAIRELARQRLDEYRAAGVLVVFYMAPLLIEAGADKLVDEIWVIDIDEAGQEARIIARDGLSREETRQRTAAQMPLADKAARGDVVIENRGSVAELEARLKALWERESCSEKA